MKLSTKGRYGLRILLDLALNGRESRVTLASISDRQGTSERYLEQVAVTLRKAGYIRSVKGALGGYMLAQEPQEIVVGDVLRALEGDVLVVDPEKDLLVKTRIRSCLYQNIYEPLNAAIAQIVDHRTLQDLIDIYYKKQAERVEMYYI